MLSNLFSCYSIFFLSVKFSYFQFIFYFYVQFLDFQFFFSLHQTSPWSGLAITSPFDSPSAAIVVSVDGSGSDLPQEGQRYKLHEDLSVTKVFDSLNATVSYGAQRPTHFVVMEVADGWVSQLFDD